MALIIKTPKGIYDTPTDFEMELPQQARRAFAEKTCRIKLPHCELYPLL